MDVPNEHEEVWICPYCGVAHDPESYGCVPDSDFEYQQRKGSGCDGDYEDCEGSENEV